MTGHSSRTRQAPSGNRLGGSSMFFCPSPPSVYDGRRKGRTWGAFPIPVGTTLIEGSKAIRRYASQFTPVDAVIGTIVAFAQTNAQVRKAGCYFHVKHDIFSYSGVSIPLPRLFLQTSPASQLHKSCKCGKKSGERHSRYPAI